MTPEQAAAFVPSKMHWQAEIGLVRERITKAQLHYLLLNQPDPIVRGNLHRWAHKHLGVGVYELWIEPRK